MEFALQFIADSINLLDVNTYMFQTNSANYNQKCICLQARSSMLSNVCGSKYLFPFSALCLQELNKGELRGLLESAETRKMRDSTTVVCKKWPT